MRSAGTTEQPQPPEQALLHSILRSDSCAWPAHAASDPGFDSRFLALCATEDLAPIVCHHVRRSSEWSAWPEALRERLLRDARNAAAVELMREREIVTVLSALHAAGIELLLLKGTPLAYSIYPEPSLRTRCDTDVLIRTEDRPRVQRVLEDAGYRRPNAVSGTLVSYEDAFCKRAGGVDHVVDVHWQVNNGQLFAQALTFDDAWERSLRVPALAPSARTLCIAHALFLACMHRAAHLGVDGPGACRLVWLLDIHLLAGLARADDWREFIARCREHSMREISADALAHCARILHTAIPKEVRDALARPGRAEPSAVYLRHDRRRLFLADLRALPTWRQRSALVRESLFPPPDYMLAKYGARQRWIVPWLYVRRFASGVHSVWHVR